MVIKYFKFVDFQIKMVVLSHCIYLKLIVFEMIILDLVIGYAFQFEEVHLKREI